ncbi:ADP-ribosylation factor-like protein 4C, partial [Nibea albiflora]
MGNSFSNLGAFQSLHIVMLGLDSAGKTTVLYRLKFNEFVNTEKLRPLWKPYSRCTDGIVYVVDSVDAERLEEARTELHKITRFSENQGTPLLVIANKQDLPRALDVGEIERQLALA